MCGYVAELKRDDQTFADKLGVVDAGQDVRSSTERQCTGRCANCQMKN